MKGLASIALAAAHLAEAERQLPSVDNEGEGGPRSAENEGPEEPREKEGGPEAAPRPFAGISILASATNQTPWAAFNNKAVVVSRSSSLESSASSSDPIVDATDDMPSQCHKISSADLVPGAPPKRVPTGAPSSTSSASPSRQAETKKDEPTAPPPPILPDAVITTINDNDVLCGRGGETNHHPGNVRYRTLVKSHQRSYLAAKRRDKPRIARLIVDIVRNRAPPGRFLKRDASNGGWKDVGNEKAREKTSQALREGAPEIRDASATHAAAAAAPGAIPISPKPVAPNERSSDGAAAFAETQAGQSQGRGTPSPPRRRRSKKRKLDDDDCATPSARPQRRHRTYDPSALPPPRDVVPRPTPSPQYLPRHLRQPQHPYLPFATGTLPPPPYLSPTFPTTVSADDEDCCVASPPSSSAASPFPSSPSPSAASPPAAADAPGGGKPCAARGPRLRILKARLKSDPYLLAMPRVVAD